MKKEYQAAMNIINNSQMKHEFLVTKELAGINRKTKKKIVLGAQ